MIEQIEAELFHDFQTKGRSRPARLTCRNKDGKQIEVFIKFAGGVPDHYMGLCAEVLCSAIARHLGFLTPDPYIVNLSPAFLDGAPKAAKDLISRSLGLNFGTVAVGSGYSVMPAKPRLTPDLRKVAAGIYAFDILIQNFDRKWDNPNLLWNQQQNRIMLIDHESALSPILQWQDLSFANLNLDRFYDHVFYEPISPKDADFQKLCDALQTMTPLVLDEFFDLTPTSWWDQNTLIKVREYLNFVVDNRQPLCDLIRERIS